MSGGAVALPTSDPELRVLQLPHGPLAYTDEGPAEAPAIVALHGVPGSVRDFRYLAPQLVPHVRLVRVDLPGFGGSAPMDAAVRTLSGRAAMVRALAGHLGLRQYVALGHSMGGGAALVLASEEATHVRGLVLVSSLALRLHRGLGFNPSAFAAIAAALRLPLVGHALLPLVRSQYRRRRFPGVDQMGRDRAALQMAALSAVDFDLLRRAARGPLPRVLMAYARDDHMIETPISEELAGALPEARVIAFDTGGHNLQKTRAVELGEAIREWMRSFPPP